MPISADAFAALSHQNRPTCSFARVLDQLDKGDLAVVTAALEDENVTAVAIGKVLTAEGYRMKGQTVARHRRGACGCAD